MLSNIFAICKLPSPLRVIHERVRAEDALLYSDMSAKKLRMSWDSTTRRPSAIS